MAKFWKKQQILELILFNFQDSICRTNKIAEFHTELERIPIDLLRNNAYINCSVKLEQCLMLGNYNKIIAMG